MKRKAPWFPFYAADWNGDEQVRLLSLEAQGAYVRLLAHSWLERSIPADPDSIGILLGDRRLGKKVWPALARFWEPKPGEPGRLVNQRLERERKSQDDYSEEQRERGRIGNESRARMRLHAGREEQATEKVASATASATAQQSQVRTQVASQTGRSVQPDPEVPPLPPLPGGEGRSSPGTLTRPDPDPAPEPSGGRPSADLARIEATSALAAGLTGIGYRKGKPSFVIAKRAADLVSEGMTPEDATELVRIARTRGDNPAALLSHWVDNGLWRSVLDEAAAKDRAAEARARGAAAASQGDVGPIYGEEPKPIKELSKPVIA